MNEACGHMWTCWSVVSDYSMGTQVIRYFDIPTVFPPRRPGLIMTDVLRRTLDRVVVILPIFESTNIFDIIHTLFYGREIFQRCRSICGAISGGVKDAVGGDLYRLFGGGVVTFATRR